MNSNTTQTPNSVPATTNGGQNGASSTAVAESSMDVLARMVAQRESSHTPATESSPTSSAQDDPANSNAVATSNPPGQENLSPKETSEGGADEAAATGEVPGVISQGGEGATTEDAELEEALKGLNDDAKAHLLEMAKAVAEGKTNLGELKRGHKLSAQFNQKIEELQRTVEELKAGNGGQTEQTNRTNGSGAVAKFKSVNDVQARQVEAKTEVRAIEDFLEDNPDGGQIGNQQFTRKQLIEHKRRIQDELESLPQHAQQIQQQEVVQGKQREMRTLLQNKLPQYFDAENPIGRKAQEIIKTIPEVAHAPNRDFIALALAIGEEQLMKLINPPAAKPAAAAPGAHRAPLQGKVPMGKPHSSTGGVPPRTNGSIPVGAALDGLRNKGSKDSLATLLSVTGR